MSIGERDDAPNVDSEAGTAFTEIPLIPAASASGRGPGRVRRLVAPVLIVLLVVGMVLAYLSRPAGEVDPNAPRVVAEMRGMHCPIQCGLRVASALETLPWVVPGSVTANPTTGVVTFAVTSAGAVAEADVRRVIERAGFRVISVTLPTAVSHHGPESS
jgi:hypothetical protein